MLNLERLEERAVLASASLANGVLTVKGSNLSETINVAQNDGSITVTGHNGSFNANSVNRVVVYGYGGNDHIDVRSVRGSANFTGTSLFGGFGNDFMVGTAVRDYIYGEGNNDTLFGMDGSDVLSGGDNNDKLFGMAGYDYLYGGYGVDFLDDGNRSAQEFFDGGYGTDYNADVVAIAGTTINDVAQNNTPTCSLLASLAGLTREGYNFKNWISYRGFTAQGVPQYDVAFWKNGAWQWVTVDFDGTTTNADPISKAEGESWVILMNRGWIKFWGGDGRAWPHETLHHLTGGSPTHKFGPFSTSDFDTIATALKSGTKTVVAATNVDAASSYFVDNHSYTVVGTDVVTRITYINGAFGIKIPVVTLDRYVTIRNPWGVDGGTVSGLNDGYLRISWSSFTSNFRYFAVV